MQRVVFAREAFRQIRIALPVRVHIAVGEAAVASGIGAVVARGAAMRQRIAVRVANDFSRRRAAREIAFAARIAPRAFRIPVPRLDVQFRVLPVGHRLPPRAQNFFERLRSEELVDRRRRHAVDARAQRLVRHEFVRHVVRGDVDADGLRKRRAMRGLPGECRCIRKSNRRVPASLMDG